MPLPKKPIDWKPGKGSMWQLKKAHGAAPDFSGYACCPLCQKVFAMAAWKNLHSDNRTWQLALALTSLEEQELIRKRTAEKRKREEEQGLR